MRSRALRLTFGAVACIAIGAVAFLLIRSEEEIGVLVSSVRAFDQHAREATDAFADARVAQQAYVAAGQGAGFWMNRVSATTEAATATPFAPPAMFKAAAELATDFGRVRDLDELTKILGRAGDVMGASGLIVWMGSTAGAELRPVLFHGYSPEMIARIPPVPRSANNAASAAYRS